jgi:trans-2-enoyl-CoA reductase
MVEGSAVKNLIMGRLTGAGFGVGTSTTAFGANAGGAPIFFLHPDATKQIPSAKATALAFLIVILSSASNLAASISEGGKVQPFLTRLLRPNGLFV